MGGVLPPVYKSVIGKTNYDHMCEFSKMSYKYVITFEKAAFKNDDNKTFQKVQIFTIHK